MGDGVITGQSEIQGRPVYLFAQNFTVIGGSDGKTHRKKIARSMKMAIQNGAYEVLIDENQVEKGVLLISLEPEENSSQ